MRTSRDKGRTGNYSLQRGEDEGGHGAKEHGAKRNERRRGRGKDKGTTGEASGTWENKGTDMEAKGWIKMKQWNKRKLYSGLDQASWPRGGSGDRVARTRRGGRDQGFLVVQR